MVHVWFQMEHSRHCELVGVHKGLRSSVVKLARAAHRKEEEGGGRDVNNMELEI